MGKEIVVSNLNPDPGFQYKQNNVTSQRSTMRTICAGTLATFVSALVAGFVGLIIAVVGHFSATFVLNVALWGAVIIAPVVCAIKVSQSLRGQVRFEDVLRLLTLRSIQRIRTDYHNDEQHKIVIQSSLFRKRSIEYSKIRKDEEWLRKLENHMNSAVRSARESQK